jgi:uncharacterized protein YbcI
MLKITLAELKKSLYAIKNNNELQCIAGEQLVNINNNIRIKNDFRSPTRAFFSQVTTKVSRQKLSTGARATA